MSVRCRIGCVTERMIAVMVRMRIGRIAKITNVQRIGSGVLMNGEWAKKFDPYFVTLRSSKMYTDE